MRLLLVILAAIAWSGHAAITQVTPCPLSQDTPLRSLNASFLAHPPVLGTAQDDRYDLLVALDCWAKRADTVYWDCYRNESNADLWAYHISRMQRVLDEVAAATVQKGTIRAWKMYSSGSIVKTSQGVFSTDVVQGPWKDITRYIGDPAATAEGSCRDAGSLPESKGGVFTWKWPASMVDQYAALVDVHFTSHRHGDHTDYTLVDTLMRKGKTVVVANDTKKIWTTCSEHTCTSGIGGPPISWKNSTRLIAFPADTNIRVGPFEIRRLGGPTPAEPLRQGMHTAPNGTWLCGAKDPLMNVNLIRHYADPNEFTFMQNGDNRCASILPGLRRAVAAGWTPTLFHRIMSWSPAALHDNLDHEVFKIVPGVKIYPGHEYEWGHKGGHPPRPWGLTYLASQYATHRKDGMVANGTFFVVTWGESVECGAGTCG